MYCKTFTGMKKHWPLQISDIFRVSWSSRRTCHMTRRSRITCSAQFQFHTNMAFQTGSFLPCKGSLLLLFSLFCCHFGMGEGQFKGFRRLSRMQGSSSPRGALEEQWFPQKLDHFNGADSREWKQVSRPECAYGIARVQVNKLIITTLIFL